MKQHLYFNGTGPAVNEMFGCPCNRCNSQARLANVSISLIVHDGAGKTLHHVLFDAGDGVATSLAQSPWLKHTNGRLDQLFLSHWHRDHTLHLNRIAVANHLRGLRLGINPNNPVSLWCRSGTASWLTDLYEFEIANYLKVLEFGEQHLPGTLLEPLYVECSPSITITPFSLSHFSADFGLDRETYVSSCSGFVIQSSNKKVVFFWDADTTNEKWVTAPATDSQKEAVKLLSDADYLIIDTTTWLGRYDRDYQHLAFPNTMTIAKALRPKVTMPVHISGHPDGVNTGSWGWTDAEWQRHGEQAWKENNISGNYIVPSIGTTIEL